MPGKRKTPKDSLTVLTDTVLPGETNAINNLFGGELLARMDKIVQNKDKELYLPQKP